MRKKLTAILLAFVCVLALTACGSSSNTKEQEVPAEMKTMLFSQAENDAQQMDAIVKAGQIEEQKSEAVVYAGLQGWESAKEEIGELDFTTDADGNGVPDCFTEKSITTDEDGNYIVTVGLNAEKRNADLVVTYAKDLSGYVSIATNVEYTFGELMQQAGLNTLLGMGTTFAVLILLSLIIALFGRLLTSAGKKKVAEEDKKEQEAAAKRAAAPAPAPAAPAASDDGQLVAVIAAAIAAYRAEAEPAAAPDAFVVRKIRRIRRK
jgi:sodium pump decarboxylase gamma subunit